MKFWERFFDVGFDIARGVVFVASAVMLYRLSKDDKDE